MPEIQWILFSKQRTLQAKSCVLSLVALSDVKPEDITILYCDSEKIDYEPLKRELGCRFVRQTDFYRNVLDIVEGSRAPLIGFLVDDLIFKDRFSSAQIGRIMRVHPDLECFSLRMGRNIQDGRPPRFEALEPGILSWKTAGGLGTSWNYFWELSSSIYPKKLVLDYMKRCSGKAVTYPNPM